MHRIGFKFASEFIFGKKMRFPKIRFHQIYGKWFLACIKFWFLTFFSLVSKSNYIFYLFVSSGTTIKFVARLFRIECSLRWNIKTGQKHFISWEFPIQFAENVEKIENFRILPLTFEFITFYAENLDSYAIARSKG